jgi:hypothetical protein
MATLVADEKVSFPGGAFSVPAFCETNFAAGRSVGGFAAGVAGGRKLTNQ